MASIIVPPGGFAGFNQMTPASRRALATSTPRATGQRRRRKAKATSQRPRRAKRAKGSGRKLKFGSPAWQKKYKVGRFAKK